MEDSQVWNRDKERFDKYSNNQHHLIKTFNICWSKISQWENRGSPEDHRKKVKTWMGTQMRIATKIFKQKMKTYSDVMKKVRQLDQKIKLETQIENYWQTMEE